MRIPCWLLLALATAGPASAAVLDLPGAADIVLSGDREGDLAGACFAHGDFDGDGTDDLAIGVLGGSPFRESKMRNGLIQILFGAPDVAETLSGTVGTIPYSIVGTSDGQSLGGNLAAGDFDGDGFDDLLVGAPWATEGDSTLLEGGAAYLVRGRARGAFPHVLVLPDSSDAVFLPPEKSVHLGEAVAFGDWNGDGRADAAIGAMYGSGLDGVRPHAGTTYVYFGRSRRGLKKRISIAKAADLTIHGAERDDTSGRSLAFTDWNGDDRQDLLIGAYYGDGPENTRTDPGEAYLLLGGTKKGIKKKTVDLAQPGPAFPIYGFSPLGAFARSSAAGDLDGDSLGDFVIAAYRAPEPENAVRGLAGIVDVIFGSKEPPAPMDLATSAQFRILGARYYDKTGRYVQTGDLNGDGRAELVVGIPFGDAADSASALRLQCGLVGIVIGRARADFPDTLDLATTPFDHLLRGAEAEDQIPMGLDILDIDADGKQDLVIGAPFTSGPDNARPRCGEVYFLLGASRSW